jgi:ketosteroid isomerase-like protein
VIPYSGTFRGKEEVAEFFRVLEACENLHSFAPSEFIVDEKLGAVCVLGGETAVAIATGKRFSTTWAEIFRIRDGLIVEFQEHIDTFAMAEAYTPS